MLDYSDQSSRKAGYDARKSPGKFKVNARARLTRPTDYGLRTKPTVWNWPI